MRRSFIAMVASIALVLAAGPARAGTRTQLRFDLDGFTLQCPTHTYTFLPGSRSVFDVFDSTSASGNTVEVLTTDASSDVHLVDSSGATYTVRGVIVSADTSRANTYIAKLLIVADAGGGVSNAENLVIHSSPNGTSFSFEFGTCEFD